MTSVSSVKGDDIKIGQTIKSASRWYTVISVADESRFSRTLFVENCKGQRHHLAVGRDDDYPTKG